MFGGLGNDTYIVDNAGDRATETSGSGGTDTVLSSVSFTLASSVENLTLTGSGNITGVGNDLANSITGNSGNNILAGGLGADTIGGGGGNDSFVYRTVSESNSAATDHVLAFDTGDKLDLSQIDANSGTPTNDAFSFIGAGAFTGAAGQLRAYQSGADWIVEGDTDGNGSADLVIQVSTANGHAIVAGDFVF
ncbi:MAG: hypothetical protein E6G94_01295 [Alphaproteobacteria bacterium]|nr:MAG: hypothetical protein E6G94_01295 [Alphaproteobacteria bacterium]